MVGGVIAETTDDAASAGISDDLDLPAPRRRKNTTIAVWKTVVDVTTTMMMEKRMSPTVATPILIAGMMMMKRMMITTMIVTSHIDGTTIAMKVIDVVVVETVMKTMTTLTTMTPTVTNRDLAHRRPTKGHRGREDRPRRMEDTRGDRRQSVESEGNARRYRRWFHRLSKGR